MIVQDKYFFEGASEREIKTNEHSCTHKKNTVVKGYIYNITYSLVMQHDMTKRVPFP